MSYLTLDADRLVRDAVDAFLEDRSKPDSGGDCVYATRNSQYRVVEGTVQEASDTSLMGAELVGWLVEEMGQPLFEARWRPFGRAIFVERRSRHVVVTSRTLSRNAISGNVSPVPVMRRKPSVIPPSPPIPVLRASQPPTRHIVPDGSPTPFRIPDAVRESARAIADLPPAPTPRRSAQAPSKSGAAAISFDPAPPSSRRGGAIPDVRSEDDRPTTRPPPDEATVNAERSSYEDLLEASRTPALVSGAPRIDLLAGPPPTPSRPVQLPPVHAPARAVITLAQDDTLEIDMSAEVEEVSNVEDLPTRTGR